MKLRDACSLKAMTNLDSVLKSRDITLPPKVCIVKAMVFPVQFSSVTQLCPNLCDPMDCSMPWFFLYMRVGPYRKLSAEEWMLLNCGVGEAS